MARRFSRLTRLEEKRAYRRFFLSIVGSVALLLLVVFLGLPALIKFSLFIGSLRTGSETSSQQQDTTPPFPPHLEAPYTATNAATIAISGYSEPNSTIEIFLNRSSLKKVLLGNDGQFNFPDTFLKEGENKITALATDASGNTSQPTDPLIIVYKKTLPSLLVDQPQEGESFSGEKNEAGIVGLTDPGVNLTINGRLIMLKNDGSFSYNFPLSPGENLIKIIATDIAGNQKIIERRVTFSP